jgi:hypothetical protein
MILTRSGSSLIAIYSADPEISPLRDGEVRVIACMRDTLKHLSALPTVDSLPAA